MLGRFRRRRAILLGSRSGATWEEREGGKGGRKGRRKEEKEGGGRGGRKGREEGEKKGGEGGGEEAKGREMKAEDRQKVR
jgi:hypothetical protein